MKILVAGTNKNGNDDEKDRIIELFRTNPKLEVLDSRELFRYQLSSFEGNVEVLKALRECHILYVVNSINGYIGFATAVKIGYQFSLETIPWKLCYTSLDTPAPYLRYAAVEGGDS